MHIYNGREINFDIIYEIGNKGQIITQYSTYHHLADISKYGVNQKLEQYSK